MPTHDIIDNRNEKLVDHINVLDDGTLLLFTSLFTKGWTFDVSWAWCQGFSMLPFVDEFTESLF